MRFVVITGTNICLILSHFDPYSLGSGSRCDDKCKDLYLNIVKLARIDIYSNAF